MPALSRRRHGMANVSTHTSFPKLIRGGGASYNKGLVAGIGFEPMTFRL